jgi:hypothetical protein
METVRIKFSDFWKGFKPDNNYFFNSISGSYHIELSDNPDILIYSCYGNDYLNYNCTKVFYTAENVRPDFSACDFAISFDFNQHPDHYRLPLFVLYIDQLNALPVLLKPKIREEILQKWRAKKKFCCMVVSNPNADKRIDFFRQLSSYKKVDSGGRLLNNVGGPVEDKLDFIKDYRFVIAFENEVAEGYTTEKIFEPLLAGCIPLYWGNPLIEKDFNPAVFLHLSSSKSMNEFIGEIIQIDNNEDKAMEILMAPVFKDNFIPEYIDKRKIVEFFEKVFQHKYHRRPVAITARGKVYKYKMKTQNFISLSKRLINKMTKIIR